MRSFLCYIHLYLKFSLFVADFRVVRLVSVMSSLCLGQNPSRSIPFAQRFPFFATLNVILFGSSERE